MDDERSTTEQTRPRTAVVAGGTGALGSAVVDVLLERGERVCVPWRTEGPALRLREAHADAVGAGRLRLSRCDVTDLDALAALLDVLRADWGPLWLACSTAGGWAGGAPLEQLHDMSVLDRMVHENLRTAVAVAAEGVRHMGPAGGRVVLVGSAADRAKPGQAAYAAANAAVRALVPTLALELRGSGRTANVVVPTVLDTPANRQSMPAADFRRWAAPRAVAEVIAWLGTVESSAVNGAAIAVPGGG